MTIQLTTCGLLLAFASGALLITSRLAGAQTDSAKAARSAAVVNVRLHIVRDDDTPIIGAEVLVKHDRIERIGRSDSSGIARVERLTPGSIEIRVRRVGFKQSQFLASVSSGDNAFTITVGGTSAPLEELRVVGTHRVVGRLEDFDLRTKHGDAGAVVTQAQIDKRNPVKLSQMLRGMPGLRLADSLGSTVAISTRGQKLGGGGRGLVDCVMRVMVDGIVMPAYTSIDGIFPMDAYGIEVFNGPTRIPLNLGGVRQDAWCGLIAIWTRSG